MKRVLFTIFIFILTTLPISAERIEFLLSSKEVKKGEPLIVEARFPGQVSLAPTQKVFTSGSVKAIYSGVMTETKIINFKASTYTSLRFSIIETKPGKHRIPPIAVRLNGEVHTIPETYFTVSNISSPHPGNSLAKRFSQFHDRPKRIDKDDLMVRFQTSKNTVFVGEPVIGYFILYSKSQQKLNFERNPNSSISFPFFTSELLNGVQISYPEEIRLESHANEIFHTHPYNREIFALTPLKKGTYSLGMTKFDIIQPMSFRFEAESLDVNPQRIQVRDLPPNQPDSFSGEVGEYAIFANYEGTETTQGNPWRFSITIKGSGLCNRIKDPVLDRVPKNYPGSIVSLGVNRERKFSEIESGQFGFQCEAEFRYAAHLNADAPSFPIEFTFFHPEEGNYNTKRISIPSIKNLPKLSSHHEEVAWEDFSNHGHQIPWLGILKWSGFFFVLMSALGIYKFKIEPPIKRKNLYLENLNHLAGNKTGLILEKAFAKSLSSEEAKFWRGVSEKYGTQNFMKIYSLLDYKERETLESWLKKENKTNEQP